MCTFNRPQYIIRESIQSVLSQTFGDFELIVRNDGGDDKAKEVIDSFDCPKITYHRLVTNAGLSAALNECVLRAHGEYIAYLDDDDIYYPTHLETLVDVVEENGGLEFVYSNAWWSFGKWQDFSFAESSRRRHEKGP